MENEGWLLGGFGGAIWRSMKAGKGFGLLENGEGGWLWISGGKGGGLGVGIALGWRPLSGMPRRTLRHSLLTLSFLELEGAEEENEWSLRWRKLGSGMGLWFANSW